MHPSDLPFIGKVHSDILSIKDAPKFHAESDRTGTLEIFPQIPRRAEGHRRRSDHHCPLLVPSGRPERPASLPARDKLRGLHGVFATRSPMRPNPIAISELKVLAVDGCRIEVSGLDILNGTPIVDIKNIPA